MTVLITGATGQVGNAIARRLADDGVEVRALVRSPSRAEVLPVRVQPVMGDVTDAASVRAALEGAATVYHALGVDLGHEFPGPGGRPVPVVDYGVKPIVELF